MVAKFYFYYNKKNFNFQINLKNEKKELIHHLGNISKRQNNVPLSSTKFVPMFIPKL